MKCLAMYVTGIDGSYIGGGGKDQSPFEKQGTVLPRILLHAVKSEVYQKFGFGILINFCMQL